MLHLSDSGSYDIESDPAPVEDPGLMKSPRQPGVGLLYLLNFGFQYGIPYTDLWRLGVRDEKQVANVRLTYTLGAGHTATVIHHEAGVETRSMVPEGTSIALKSFVPDSTADIQGDQDLEQSAARSETYRAILQELKVFCHPNLSEHPNIVKLLFLGWKEQSPFPFLGLELGNYGSLDYILRAPGTGMSQLQKSHVSLDIALGLNALHENNFVTGDLKPENIVVLRNPDPKRSIIAKLTDFGGVSRALIGEAPRFVTRLWCAPEVVNKDKDIEWDKSDVYSFGLILASIWCRPEQYQTERRRSSSILSSFVPEILDDDDEQRVLWLLKSSDTKKPESALFKILDRLPDAAEPFVAEVLRATLIPDFWLRPSMSGLVSDHLAQISFKLGRNLE